MKKIISVVVGSTVLSSAVLAAHSFDGFKVGINLGTAFSAGKARLTGTDRNLGNSDTVSGDKAAKSMLGGLSLSWDKAAPNQILYGVETFFDVNDLKGNISDPDPNRYNMHLKAGADYTVGVMGRVGYAFDKSVMYFGIGWIGTKWNLKGTIDSRSIGGQLTTLKSSKLISGLRFSGAIGTEVCEKFFATLEGSYTVYQKVKAKKTFVDITSFGNNALATGTYRPTLLEAKLKLSYKI